MIMNKEEAALTRAVQEKIVHYEPLCGVIARLLLDTHVTVIPLVFGSSGCISFETTGASQTFDLKRVRREREIPLWFSGQSSWLQIRRPGFDSQHYQEKKSSGSGTGSTQPREYN
jgi:hypothetical protein